MNQLLTIWKSLTRSQQVSLIVVPIVICAVVFGLLRWKHENAFRVLYSNLSPEDAAAVTQKIREAGIEYRVDETGAVVSVTSDRLADARMALAGAGLPKSGRIGFELFDRANLGASDFAEQVNYRRALEGELERTVATLSEVDQARIHITFAKDSVFLDARQPSKATVVLRLKRVSRLPQPSVVAIANLVASAVEGLSPDAVAIIDSNGRLLSRPLVSGDGDAQLAEANLDYRRQVESELLTKINTALGPLLGPDRFHASVNADCDFSSSEENEETVDPTKSAILTSQTTEESSGGTLAGGTPGTASNLPRPTARTTTGASGLSRKTENASFQPSRIVKHTISPKGTIRRISTAVLVDQTVRWDGVGPKARRTFIPPSAEVLKGVHDIVAGITGFSDTRGDQITVETLPFENTIEAEPPPAPSSVTKPVPSRFSFKQPAVIGGTALLMILVTALAFLLTRRKRSGRSAANTGAEGIAGGATRQGLADGRTSGDHDIEGQISENDARQALLEAEALNRIKLPANTKKTDVLAKHIRDSIHKDATNATNVLRTWISEGETKRTT
jgi:flagellar M-ring protein FliF